MKKKQFLVMTASISLILMALPSFAEKTIRFASSVYPPFVTIDKDKNLQGFEIELTEAICKKMNAKCTFSNDKLKNMIPSIKSGKYDAWISAITINKERKKELSFTKPYFSSSAKLLAKKHSIFSGAPNEIKGKTIGVEVHTCHIKYLKKTYGNTIKIKPFVSKKECFSALRNGSVDAIIDDSFVLKYWRRKQLDGKKYRLIGLPAKFPKLVWHKYGIAVAKNNQKLAGSLNDAIAKIKYDGTYRRLVKKYFATNN